MAAGAAGSVERAAVRERVEDTPDRGLLDADQRVAGAVVRLRPSGVPGAGVELGDVGAEPVRGFVVGTDDAPHLVDPGLGRLVVVHQRAEERKTLDGDEELAETHVSGHRPTVPARPAAHV